MPINRNHVMQENIEEDGLGWPLSWERGQAELREGRRLAALRRRLDTIIGRGSIL